MVCSDALSGGSTIALLKPGTWGVKDGRPRFLDLLFAILLLFICHVTRDLVSPGTDGWAHGTKLQRDMVPDVPTLSRRSCDSESSMPLARTTGRSANGSRRPLAAERQWTRTLQCYLHEQVSSMRISAHFHSDGLVTFPAGILPSCLPFLPAFSGGFRG